MNYEATTILKLTGNINLLRRIIAIWWPSFALPEALITHIHCEDGKGSPISHVLCWYKGARYYSPRTLTTDEVLAVLDKKHRFRTAGLRDATGEEFDFWLVDGAEVIVGPDLSRDPYLTTEANETDCDNLGNLAAFIAGRPHDITATCPKKKRRS